MATPPRPTADTIISSAWGTAVHDKVFGFGWVTAATVTTDASAFFSLTSAQFGLATIVGGIAQAKLAGAPSATDAVWAVDVSMGSSGAALIGRAVQMYGQTSWGYLASRSVVVSAMAWGTVAATRDEAELLPGPDEDRPELNPQET